MNKTSEEYLKLYQGLHEGAEYKIGDNVYSDPKGRMFDGSNFYEKLWEDFKKWATPRRAFRVLDFGCGKAKHLFEPHLEKKTFHQFFAGKVQEYYCYDPGFRKFSRPPPFDASFDALICADVMEHIPDEDVDEVVRKMKAWMQPDGTLFVSISGMAAKKSFMDGENLHVNVQPLEYWVAKFEKLHRRFVMAYTNINGTVMYRKI